MITNYMQEENREVCTCVCANKQEATSSEFALYFPVCYHFQVQSCRKCMAILLKIKLYSGLTFKNKVPSLLKLTNESTQISISSLHLPTLLYGKRKELTSVLCQWHNNPKYWGRTSSYVPACYQNKMPSSSNSALIWESHRKFHIDFIRIYCVCAWMFHNK